MPFFQSGFIPVFMAVSLYGVLHSALASQRVKAFFERRSGDLYRRWYRLVFNITAGLTLLPALFFIATFPDHILYTIPRPWVTLTLGLQGLSAVGLLAGVMQTGAAEFLGLSQLARTGNRPAELVTSGLYKLVRHPLYTFGLIILWLTPVMTLNILSFNLAATLYLAIGILLEERKLAAEFETAYRDYCRRTPMLLPLKLRRRG